MTKVAISGYFNPIHVGHIDLINAASKLGDELIVIVNNDKQVELKNSTIFMKELERVFIVAHIKNVTSAILSKDKDRTVCETLRFIKPDIFANGGDRMTVGDVPETQVCSELGIKMEFNVGGKKVQSSSWLLEKVKNGN